MEQNAKYLVNIRVLVVVLEQYSMFCFNPLRFKTLRLM